MTHWWDLTALWAGLGFGLGYLVCRVANWRRQRRKITP